MSSGDGKLKAWQQVGAYRVTLATSATPASLPRLEPATNQFSGKHGPFSGMPEQE
jgi:hypothetical protein